MLLSVVNLLVLFLVSNTTAHAGQSLPETYTLSAADLIRVRASTDEQKSTVVEWQGQVLSYKPGDVPKVLFNVQGMNIARAKKLEDGGYDLLSREKFPASTTYQARYQPGGTYSFRLTIPLAYPNPLDPTGDFMSPLYHYVGPTQASYTAIESFTFTFPSKELKSPSTSVSSTQVYWTRTSPLLPFMATPSTNVTLLFVASGSKVEGGWKNLSPVVRDLIATMADCVQECTG
ncbi:hypothetical protein C0995_006701 [Termitomyces sp. Mi166|nr:hypothetical protein C0995_006701 [Termitomyces sp. Mi166\